MALGWVPLATGLAGGAMSGILGGQQREYDSDAASQMRQQAMQAIAQIQNQMRMMQQQQQAYRQNVLTPLIDPRMMTMNQQMRSASASRHAAAQTERTKRSGFERGAAGSGRQKANLSSIWDNLWATLQSIGAQEQAQGRQMWQQSLGQEQQMGMQAMNAIAQMQANLPVHHQQAGNWFTDALTGGLQGAGMGAGIASDWMEAMG